MMTDREIFMALVDADSIHKSDVIVLLEGDGFNRYQHAVNLYRDGLAPIIVFSGGITDYDYGSYPYEEIEPLMLKLGVNKDDVCHESTSLHTKQQADEIIRLCIEKGWTKIILVGSHYHQYRAYLTFLKSMFNANVSLQIYNSPVRELSWFSFNEWGDRLSCLKNEFERIERYFLQNDLVSYKEAIAYQQWKEQQ